MKRNEEMFFIEFTMNRATHSSVLLCDGAKYVSVCISRNSIVLQSSQGREKR